MHSIEEAKHQIHCIDVTSNALLCSIYSSWYFYKIVHLLCFYEKHTEVREVERCYESHILLTQFTQV